jgi:flagellar basal body-associated protein FliL
MPDLGKTIASAPTSEIRPKETGPATVPPPPSQQTTPPPAQRPEPPPQAPPQAPREMMPTVAFNQPPAVPPPPQQQQYYAPPSQATSAPTTPPAVQDPYAQMQPQYAPAPQQQYQHPSRPAPSKKSSRAPLIVGLVVLVLLSGLAAWYFLVYKKGESSAAGNTNANANANTAANTNANANTAGNTNANTTANANASSTPVPPGAGETQFVNASANLDGKLAENYSDFSFNYPSGWEKDPKAGVAGASNFVKVERRLPPDFTQENFAVSWYESTGTDESDERAGVFQKLVASWKSRLAKNFPEFEAFADGPTTVNGIKGYELRFQSVSRGTEKGDITLWGRVVFLPPGAEGKKNGTQLLMLTTSLAPELTSADDIGVKGQLPVILNSFKMGSK